MSTKAAGPVTRLDRLHQSGAYRMMFPRPTGSALEGVIVNTSGGVTGGDSFELLAEVGSDTSLTLTTQAAERAYRALPGQTGTIRNILTVGAEARLNWLPQETILFDGCNIDRTLTIELAPRAQLLACEALVFGRTAMAEDVRKAAFQDAITITRDGLPYLADRTRLTGDIASRLDQPAIGGRARAMATIVLINPAAESVLDAVRGHLGPTAGASLLQPDTLVVRMLAPDGYALRKTLVPVLATLGADPLPRPWMI